jgi:hypothetical protein
MGMCLVMCTLSDSNISRVLADPPLVWKVVAPDDPEMYEKARKGSDGFLSRILRREKAAEGGVATFDLSAGEGSSVDLDKAWHGIHFLLTKSAWEGDAPLNFLVSGGRQVGNLEVGYGPARVFSSEEVRAIITALDQIDEEALRARFDPAEMMRLQIYPEIWDRDPAEDDSFGYCAEYFTVLKECVADAAARSQGLVIYIS